MALQRIFQSERNTSGIIIGVLAGFALLQYGITSPTAGMTDEVVLGAQLAGCMGLARMLRKKVWQPLQDTLQHVRQLDLSAGAHQGDGHSLLIPLRQSIAALENRLQIGIRLVKHIHASDRQALQQETDLQESRDPLVLSLIQLHTQLVHLADQEKQRLWASEGLARFADILRSNQTHPEKLYDTVLSTLVHYLKANQGVLVVRKEESGETYLDQVACYAYQRKKHVQRQIKIGEGLIGQCYLEKDTILLTDLPDQYTKITSGLGEATPTCLLIVPLKLNEEVLGVMELASFKAFQPFETEFVEKLAESIAATVASLHTQQMTSRLLAESQEQAQQLVQQESIMRQNLEEMQATQEEMQRSQQQLQQQEEPHRQKVEELILIRQELETQLNGQLQEANSQKSRMEAFLKCSLDTIAFLDEQGTIVQVNPGIEKMFGYKTNELIGKPIETVLSLPNQKFTDDYTGRAGKDFGLPLEYVGKSKMYGFLFPVEVSLGKATVDEQVLYTATIRNIAKRKEYEENMKKNLKNVQDLNDAVLKREQEIKELKAQLSTYQN